MGIQIQGNSGALYEVGGSTFKALHTHVKPIEYGSLGHYRTGAKIVLATSQGANSRMFEVRNTSGSNLLVLTRCFVLVAAAGTVTTPYRGEWGLWRLTNFSVVDTTNTTTPTSSLKRTSGMTAYPGNAQVRFCNGNVNGMTGGTLTKDGNMLTSMLANCATMAASSGTWAAREFVQDENGTHPLVCAQNEGWEVENVVVGSGTANVLHLFVDVSWAEVTAF